MRTKGVTSRDGDGGYDSARVPGSYLGAGGRTVGVSVSVPHVKNVIDVFRRKRFEKEDRQTVEAPVLRVDVQTEEVRVIQARTCQ